MPRRGPPLQLLIAVGQSCETSIPTAWLPATTLVVGKLYRLTTRTTRCNSASTESNTNARISPRNAGR